MRAHVVLLMLWMPPAAASDARVEELPSVDSLLSRAQASLGAPSPRGLRILYLGTGDATAAYQGQDWRKPESRRYQSTLIFDFETQRAALRTEQTRSDGTVSLFRNRVTRDEGTNVNLISGLAFPMSAESAQQTWAGLAWQVPHFALRQLAAERDHLRVVGRRRIDGRILVAAEFTSAGATSFTVTFDDATGALAGYEYTNPTSSVRRSTASHSSLTATYRESDAFPRATCIPSEVARIATWTSTTSVRRRKPRSIRG